MDGIYHFEFAGLKHDNADYLYVILQVNGENIGSAGTDSDALHVRDTHESYAMTASLRLKTGDKVTLFNRNGSVLYESANHKNHFTGWLVEEDLQNVV